MNIRIDYKSGLPAYLQIVEQIKYAAASGALHAGESLPSIRPLAEHLQINRNTIIKAYDVLESEGVIETRQGKGSVLAQSSSPLQRSARHAMLNGAIDTLLAKAHWLQIPREELLGLIDQGFHRLNAQTPSSAQSDPKKRDH